MYAVYNPSVLRQATLVLQVSERACCLHASFVCFGFAAVTRQRKDTADRRSAGSDHLIRLQTSQKLPIYAHGSAEALSLQADGEPQLNQFLPAILLAYFASQNRSLLAAECLIETVVELYRRGIQLDSLQFALSMATLQSGSTLLSEQELDMLTARCGIVMLTLLEIGCPTYAQAAKKQSEDTEEQQPLSRKAQQLTKGLGKFVSQIINMYRSGFNSRRMLLQQSLAGGGESDGQGGFSPFVISMQQNTRLVVLTLEMIQQSQIPTTTPLESIAPSENYPTTDPRVPGPDEQPLPSSSSSPAGPSPSSSSSDQSSTAGARKTRTDRPDEQQQNSLGSGESLTQPQGKRARAEPARDSPDEVVKVPSNLDKDKEEGMQMGQHDAKDDAGTSAATNPTDLTANPDCFHHAPDQILSPIGYISGFVDTTNPTRHAPPSSSSSLSPCSDPHSSPHSNSPLDSASDGSQHRQEEGEEQHALPAADARSAAVQLLLGFMGALQASQYAVESFVTNAIAHYRQGWSAQQLFDELKLEEFAQTGGLLPMDPRIQAAKDTPAPITAELFARWLSTAFMTLAVMGVPHPQAPQAEGWAWVTLADGSSSPSQNSVQAHRLGEVVANKLRLEEEASARQQGQEYSQQLSESALAMKSSSALQQMASQVDREPQQDQYVVLQDPTLQHTSTGYSVMSQQMEVVALTRSFVLKELQITNNLV